MELGFFEKLFRGRAMGLGAVHMRFDASDLFPEQRDAFLQLVDRQRVEILPGQLGQMVSLAVRKQVVEVHGGSV